jgi:hypothetical protein
MSCVLEADDELEISAQIAGGEEGNFFGRYAPSPFDPTDDVSAETKRIGGIEEAALRALEHGALIHEAIKDLPSLCEKLVQPRLGTLQERVLVQRVLLPARAKKPIAKRIFRCLAARGAAV